MKALWSECYAVHVRLTDTGEEFFARSRRRVSLPVARRLIKHFTNMGAEATLYVGHIEWSALPADES